MTSLVAHKRKQGKVSAYKKLEGALAKVNEYTQGAPLPFAELNAQWVTDFAGWLTQTKGKSLNTRATYLRSMYTAVRKAAKEGCEVDLTVFPTEFRANAEPVRDLPKAGINPARDCWYAMKCRAVDSEQMVKAIKEDFPGVETFRTDVPRIVETRRGKRLQAVEILRNVVFFCTAPRTCLRMKFAYHDKGYIYDYRSGDTRQMAVVSPKDLKVFMYLNDVAPDRILYYFPDEADCPRPARGQKVTVREGRFKGLTVTVSAQSRTNPLDAEVLVTFPTLGVTVTAPIPWRFLQ